MSDNQIEAYLEKYKITNKELLETHLEEIKRNTVVNSDIVFTLVEILYDEELCSKFFSAQKKNEKEYFSWILDPNLVVNNIIQGEWIENNTAGTVFEKVQDTSLNNLLQSIDEHQKQNGGKVDLDRIIYGLDEKEKFKAIFTWKLKKPNFTVKNSTPNKIFYDTCFSKIEEFLQKNLKSEDDKKHSEADWMNLKRGRIITYATKRERDSKAGKKENEGKLPIDTMLTIQFPKAIQAIAKATLFGHNKYIKTDEDWLNYKRVLGGSQTYADACARHGLEKGVIALDSGLPHIYHKCWNAMAELELWIEENENK